MIQFTTIRGINRPKLLDRAGINACRHRSTMVTKPAMTTMKQAMRMLLGMILRRAAMMMLDRVRITNTDRPMPRPLNRVVVMAITEHMPSSWTVTGFWKNRPSLNCFITFIFDYPP